MRTMLFCQIGKKTARILTLCVVALIAGMLMSQPAFARKVTNIKATRAQVAAACDAAGGSGYGYEVEGGNSYGCVTDNASIACDMDGNCTGEIFNGNESAKKGDPNIMTLLTPRSMVNEPPTKEDPRVLTPRRKMTDEPKKGTTRQPAQKMR